MCLCLPVPASEAMLALEAGIEHTSTQLAHTAPEEKTRSVVLLMPDLVLGGKVL